MVIMEYQHIWDVMNGIHRYISDACVCMYIHIYIYTDNIHIHTHIYIHIYICMMGHNQDNILHGIS